MNLKNKTILVTGANRGIGRALVEEALHLGAQRVYAATRTPFTHPDPRVTPILLDVTNAAQIRKAAANIASLDILINNAGIAQYDDLSDRSMLDRHLAVNFFGIYDLTMAFLPSLRRSKGAVVPGPLTAHRLLLDLKGGRLFADPILSRVPGRPGRKGPCCAHRAHRHRYEPWLRHPQGLPRIRRRGHIRRSIAGRGRHLPRPHVRLPGRRLARRRHQSDGTAERNLRGRATRVAA
jgi:hypothetical protein